MLRWRTWLSPGIRYAFFEFVASAVSDALDREWTLDADQTVSGPSPGPSDPFATGEVDVGFMCAPSYRILAGAALPSVQLVSAAAVWMDPRNGGKPQYFAELLVANVSKWATATSLSDLTGATFGMNDTASMSGWCGLVSRAEALGLGDSFLGEPVTTGGHLQSLEMLATGDIDAAAVDSNTILGLGGLPEGLRVVETLGPFPVQPVAAAISLDPPLVAAIADAMVALPEDRLRTFGVARFASVSPADYDL